MTTLVLEINDCGIGTALASQVFEAEPAYAWRDGQHLTFGAEARSRARIDPQSVSNRYWDTLDQETLPSEGRWQQTPAEIAYVQLEAIWQRHRSDAERAILIVPAAFNRTQLGLILGMCRKAQIPVVSLVDAAIAALREPPPAAWIVYLDLLMHRVVATLCSLDGVLSRQASGEIDHLGQTNFYSKWAGAVADVCVRTTRFDPMHSAAAEQALYDALPVALADLAANDTATMTIKAGDKDMDVSVTRATLVKAVAPLYRRIVQLIEQTAGSGADDVHVVLAGRFAEFPEMEDSLADLGRWPVQRLAVDAAVEGVAADSAPFQAAGEGVGLLIERPTASVARVSPAARPRPAPSHLLVEGEIFVLDDQPFVVGTAIKEGSWGYRAGGAVKGVSRSHCSIFLNADRAIVRDHSTYGTYVNGQRIDGECNVASGDVVRVGNPGIELRLIKEVRPSG